MKKAVLALSLCTLILFSSCATLFVKGKATECQRIKPAPGQPQRQIRTFWLIADIVLFWPSVFVDLGTAKIFKPCETKK